VVKKAQYNTGTKLPPIKDIYWKRCLRKARSIIKDHTPQSQAVHFLTVGQMVLEHEV
jgi:hypothetical protein